MYPIDTSAQGVDGQSIPRPSAATVQVTLDMLTTAHVDLVRCRDEVALARIILASAIVNVAVSLLLSIPWDYTTYGLLIMLGNFMLWGMFKRWRAQRRLNVIAAEAQEELTGHHPTQRSPVDDDTQ